MPDGYTNAVNVAYACPGNHHWAVAMVKDGMGQIVQTPHIASEYEGWWAEVEGFRLK